ncbi:uncharacterized protein FOMMEDRAFT_20966 [Fomitiporia mediterranea MF3/22]|uniref:uncharacterized protein n=1 Tax=Fomitiporia mediterranea (strain MF3/22) TaxID=694068 RepID=UPI00044085A6|nr:uncharacterized protein FOMMEDRAFT_20966 [Fomitiporia mediterranea MF3/22]EJD02183.1 hypothetical protein FOMMEDRAFT_20966 [Fomitiporia mediterranea MF3/22]
MAAVAVDVMPVTNTPSLIVDDQTQSPAVSSPDSTPFPTSAEVKENLTKDAPTAQEQQVLSPVNTRTRSTSAGPSSRPYPNGILICTDPVVEVTPACDEHAQEPQTESESSPSSESESHCLGVNGSSSRTRLSSGSSSSGFDVDSTTSSTASSTRTRATTLSSTCIAPCVTFAPLPEIGPRQRKSSRPIGLAARGQMLRQRRMMMAQDRFNYYVEECNTIPGGQRLVAESDSCNVQTQHQPGEEEDEHAFAVLGKLLGDATKVIWRRVSHTKLKEDANTKSSPRKRPTPKKTFTWPGRLRSASAGSSSPSSGRDSDEESEDDSIDGPWRRKRDEDPMTKTIVEGSDDGHGLEQFVLAYDTFPVCEEEEEDHANARVDEEYRATVEVHLVKAAEGESEA